VGPSADAGQAQTWQVQLPQTTVRLQALPTWQAEASGPASAGGLNSSMPGKVVSFAVQVGQAVQAGQAVAVVEAMKMEHTLHAPHDGTVEELFFEPGDLVGEGQPLLKLTAT
jgi:3-methylcrotonyl-CoA carboxylase alpha subunit